MRHIDDGLFVGRPLVVDKEFAVIGPGVGDCHDEIAGISLFAVSGGVAEL